MWSHRILRTLRSSADFFVTRLYLGAAAVSLATLVELDRRTPGSAAAEDTPEDDSTRMTARTSWRYAYNNLTACQAAAESGKEKSSTSSIDDQFLKQAPTAERRAILRTRQTIRRMERDSVKGQTLESRYEVDWKSPLGQGSFGVVYLGMDRETHEPVAVKKISKKLTNAAELQLEMRALLHLRDSGGHPNICSLRENFSEGEFYYLILDLVSGGELFDALVSQGAYSELDAARHIREAASALAFLHGVGVVHCDLKPEVGFCMFEFLEFDDDDLRHIIKPGNSLGKTTDSNCLFQSFRFWVRAELYAIFTKPQQCRDQADRFWLFCGC